MKKQITLLLLFVSIITFSQELTGIQLLEKSIQYHDPYDNWKTFKGESILTLSPIINLIRNN